MQLSFGGHPPQESFWHWPHPHSQVAGALQAPASVTHGWLHEARVGAIGYDHAAASYFSENRVVHTGR